MKFISTGSSAVAHFQAAYPGEKITKEDLFYYVYGLLHHPAYRERYGDNLKRDLPRLPFAPEFRRLTDGLVWGAPELGLALGLALLAACGCDKGESPRPTPKQAPPAPKQGGSPADAMAESAARTRSRASLTALSGRPTSMQKSSTSASPRRWADRTMPRSLQPPASRIFWSCWKNWTWPCQTVSTS